MSYWRPPLPPGFDSSRARERALDPAAGRFDDAARAGVWRAIAERRDIRRFRPEPLPDELLARLLRAAHQAPSVGLMQPWRFIVIRDERTKAAMQGHVSRERLVQSDFMDERARQYLDLKLEGIREAPVSIVVCCDRMPGHEVLGRHTIHDTDLYSTCLAIENLWLAACAEGAAIGWVSFYEEDALRGLLAIPEHVVPVAWLCVGYPDERPVRPGLEAAGWGRRHPLAQHVFAERWGEGAPAVVAAADAADAAAAQEADLAMAEAASAAAIAKAVTALAPIRPPHATQMSTAAARSARAAGGALPAWWRVLADPVVPADHAAAVRVRDASDELVKPAGSLGALETLLERWAAVTGGLPSVLPSVGVLVLAADHGVAAQHVSLFPARVSAQVAAAAARGDTAIGVLARALGAELLVADIGLRGPQATGVHDCRVADGSADITLGPALTDAQLRAAVEAGHALGRRLAERHEMLVVGEIGIANTTVAAALLAALTGMTPSEVCGRGTGLDAQGVERKQRAVAAALAVNEPDRDDPLGCLRSCGGLEFAGLAGAMLAAATRRRPILLDGFATGVAALAACRLQPALRDYLIAGHRSAEPAHQRVLTELGIEPLLDLRMRLGEASGAALAVPLIALAARAHGEMRRFEDAGVDRRY
ncbi:MAG: nicotinate-nucleotide--dimethylbenzimidazole phosphoribosyltransferase [Solirubrobacteraceae bacterium]